MISKLTDNELWGDVVSDSSRAFAVLYNRYWNILYKTANHYLKNESAAEEVTHDVFVALWEKRKTRTIEDFQKYIHATTRYQIFKYIKTAKAASISYLENVEETKTLVTYNTASDKLGYEDLESELSLVLKDLPRRCQEIFWLSRVNNLSNQEIADKLNISKRTVENQITCALKYLRVSYPQLAVALLIFYLK